MQAADKKRPREEKDVVVRLRPFAKLQTADDFEHFVTDILCMFLVFPIIGFILQSPPQMSKYSESESKNCNTIVEWV